MYFSIDSSNSGEQASQPVADTVLPEGTAAQAAPVQKYHCCECNAVFTNRDDIGEHMSVHFD